MIARALAGAALAGTIAFVARRARSLSASGMWAALAIGTVSIAAGWGWGALLIAWFVASTLMSRFGAVRKAVRTAGIVEKGGERDGWQVIANGGCYAIAAAAMLAAPTRAWMVFGAASLAAAAADTWSTEVGTLLGGTPRTIVTGAPVAPGTSGGITVWGTLAAAAGAAFVAATAWGAGWPSDTLTPIAIGGVAGAVADSLLGATAQARRWCGACGAATERRVHRCGASTTPSGGIAWLGNDEVNLASTIVGGLVALAVA